MISRKTIDEVFQTARVEEVIGDFVNLKKSGSSYKGLSPFSNEKTPSFMVSPAKQIWKDFSSGKGGSVVSFLMEHEQFSYPEAILWLAKRYNIEVVEDREQTEEQIVTAKTRENQYALTEFANKWFQEQLWETEEGKNVAYSYFKERGYTKPIIDKFSLGYSPKSWDAFTKYAINKGYTYEDLNAVGFTVGKKDRPVDRFRERVIFPIHSFSGRTLGFGGRMLGNNKKIAKYLNSPENEIYHKSRILYGIFHAKQSILKEDQCFLVEGYTDVISLYQSGIENVVASSGTALTPEQIRLIKRLTNNITLIYDGDAAGIKASFRGIDLMLEQELNVRVVLLPEGEDPDSYAQKHKQEEIHDFFNQKAENFIAFKIKVLKEDVRDDPAKKAALIQDVVESISLIPNLIQRELYVREAASLLDIREEILFRQLAISLIEVEKNLSKNTIAKEKKLKAVGKEGEAHVYEGDLFAFLEDKLIGLIIRYGDEKIDMPIPDSKEFYETTIVEEVFFQLDEDDLKFTTSHYAEMLREIREGLEDNEYRMGEFFVQKSNPELGKIAADLMVDKYNLSNWGKRGQYILPLDKNLHLKLQSLVLRYKRLFVLRDINEKTIKLKKMEEELDREKCIKDIIRLNEIKQKIDKLLNRSV